ncbi:MAG TPA: M14 metallopeptidase family protein [Gemmatimonadaceae bacterium]|nr:M14 metallopeptidase family protein [Gemmatimonadaceae bacterium]
MRRPTPLLLPALLALAAAAPAQQLPTPREHLGFEVGADRQLADWEQITQYFGKLASASPAVELDTLGTTTQGRPFLLAIISTPENIRKLETIRAAQARLADPRGLSAEEEARIVATQPSVVLIQNNIHSTEIASSQMVMELAYRLASVDTLQRALQNTVVLLIPSANPDGEDMVVKWYRQGVGTQWEGGPMPWLYHPYVGHDNNRDWYMVTQKETRLTTDLLYRRWFPIVFYDVHQQGNGGMRLTVPPHVDPINPNVDPLIVRMINHIGSEMSLALESRGKTGVGDGATYDLWWHGGARSTPTRHNMAGVLTEAASVRIATPIQQDAKELTGHPRGLPKYERRVNFPNPWPGGWWRLRDIVDYELIAAEALVKMMSQQREDYVRNFVSLGRKQVRLGESEAPFAYVIPAAQRDTAATAKLVDVLRVGAVEVERAASDFTAGGRRYAAGSYIVRMAQPYRAHAKDLLEPQRYPKMEKWPGGPVERPYDVAGWTLPLQMGVRVERVDSAFALPRTAMVPIRPFAAAKPPAPGRRSRVALYKPWTGNMDEGWTRWVIEQQGIAYVSLTDSMVKAGRLRDQYDAIIVPDMSLRELRDGMSARQVPPQYAGGLGATGIAELKRFAESGGTLVLLDRASELATAELGVAAKLVRVPPRQDEAEDEDRGADSTGRARLPLYAPGSILRVLVDTLHPVAKGMPDSAAVYFTNSVTFDVGAAGAAANGGAPLRVIARYPAQEEEILLSGYLQGGDAIAGKAAAVEAPLGKGRVVMFGFRPQYRGQSYGTFKLLFNALSLGGGGSRRR